MGSQGAVRHFGCEFLVICAELDAERGTPLNEPSEPIGANQGKFCHEEKPFFEVAFE
jgi:hypothetical protein